ncbi:GGDEF domain-containing response regulator [Desulfonatronovibrio magnus]|uniref:GGDEF domain-containing response regulator n=1 Tax=Desulfonatronovibrio magnus TaxID=698827 RepID=UPI0006961D2D|nr:diguanylate cyclase [Desulfonatronovibrio magnus]
MPQENNSEKILVVDDDPTARLFASRIIRKAGYEVDDAIDGNTALKKVRLFEPDLILLDVMLPDINGIEVCKTIKADPRRHSPYIILFSAIQTGSSDKALGLESGADGYLVKPVNTRELLAQIRAMLRLKRAEERLSNQKQWYETVLNSLQEVVICMDSNLNITWANKSALDSIGLQQIDVTGKKCSDVFDCTVDSMQKCPVQKSIRTGQTEDALIKTQDGRTWDTRAYPVFDQHGNLNELVEVAMDVSQNIKTRKALERSEALLSEVTTRMPGAIIQYRVLDGQRLQMVYISQGIFNLTGISAEAILASPEKFVSIIFAEDYERIFSQLMESLKKNKAFGSDFRVYGPGNNIKWLRLSTVPYETDEVTAWYAMLTDITPLKIVEQELTRKALHDPLTGLPNRQLFNDRLSQALSYAERYSQKVGLIFIDLDNFKPVNDQYGHMFGDAVLQTVAHRLNTCARKTDTVARFGGDEFVIILSSLASREDVDRILKKITEILQTDFYVDNLHLQLEASIGVSIYPDDAEEKEDLVKAADKAMYSTKQDKGITIRYYDDMSESDSRS